MGEVWVLMDSCRAGLGGRAGMADLCSSSGAPGGGPAGAGLLPGEGGAAGSRRAFLLAEGSSGLGEAKGVALAVAAVGEEGALSEAMGEATSCLGRACKAAWGRGGA